MARRDAALVPFSSEHHHALMLARACATCKDAHEQAARVSEAFTQELDPHFRAEEELLVPLLARHGEAAPLVARLHADHAALRALRTPRPDELTTFADRLESHVRFEERELFPLCERLLTREELESVAALLPQRLSSKAFPKPR